MANCHLSTLLLLLTGVTLTAGESGVYFTSQNEIYGAYGSWVLTFTVDLRPYIEQLNLLYREITQFETLVAPIKTGNFPHVPEDKRKHYVILANGTSGLIDAELKQFYQEYNNIRGVWQSIEVMLYNRFARKRDPSKPTGGRGVRTRRVLFPFMSKVLHFLFGTSSASDLRQLKRAITQLGETQSSIIHVLDRSVSLLNKTNIALSENRRAINQLTNVTKRIGNFVRDLRQKISGYATCSCFQFSAIKITSLVPSCIIQLDSELLGSGSHA